MYPYYLCNPKSTEVPLGGRTVFQQHIPPPLPPWAPNPSYCITPSPVGSRSLFMGFSTLICDKNEHRLGVLSFVEAVISTKSPSPHPTWSGLPGSNGWQGENLSVIHLVGFPYQNRFWALGTPTSWSTSWPKKYLFQLSG